MSGLRLSSGSFYIGNIPPSIVTNPPGTVITQGFVGCFDQVRSIVYLGHELLLVS